MYNILLCSQFPIYSSGFSLLLKELIPECDVFTAFSHQEIIEHIEVYSVSLIVIVDGFDVKNMLSDKLGLGIEMPPILLIYKESDAALELRKRYSIIYGLVSDRCDLDELVNSVNSAKGKKIFLCKKTLKVVMDELIGISSRKSVVAIKLSKRESEVMNMLREGKRVTQIARDLELKASTISTIKNNIFKKHGFRNMADLHNFGA